VSSPKQESTVIEVQKDSSGDIARLHRMGITDFALTTFVENIRDGQPRDQAMRALLNGRSLTRKDKDVIRTIVNRLPTR
jgi:hypothetical protein